MVNHRRFLAIAIMAIAAAGATSVGLSQPPDTLWTRAIGGATDDFAYSGQQTNDGGFIAAGVTSVAGYMDILLIKTDENGNTQWVRTYAYGWTGDDCCYGVQQTTDGGYALAGFVPGTGGPPVGPPNGTLIKTDSLGFIQWQRIYDGTYHHDDYLRSVQQTTDGGFLLGGTTYYSSAYSYQAWLIKTDALGNETGSWSYGGMNVIDNCYCARQTSDGGYILTGDANTYADLWLIKINATGGVEWQRTFGVGGQDRGNCVRQTAEGGYIVTGSSGDNDLWLIKTDSSGNTEWMRTYGGNGGESGYSVLQTDDGGYLAAGLTTSWGAGDADLWLLKTDANGDEEWNYVLGSFMGDVGYSLEQTDDLGYFVAGYTQSLVGGADAWLVRFESGVSPMDISLTPVNPPIVIPPQGGSFSFIVGLENTTSSSQTRDVWLQIELPGSGMVQTLLRSDLTLPGGANITRTLIQQVPGFAPAGTYTYKGYVGDYPWVIEDEASFTFDKAGQNSAKSLGEASDWQLSGDLGELGNSAQVANTVSDFSLFPSSPNPFNPSTVISYELRVSSQVSLRVYDTAGRLITTLVDERLPAGMHEVTFAGLGLPSGIYLAKLQAGEFTAVEKMVLLK